LKRASAGSASTSESYFTGLITELKFPELVESVRRTIDLAPGSALPKSLLGAIRQYRDRVKPAIAYLQSQQQRRAIENPVGYLYQALTEGWELSIPQAGSIVPIGFTQWFDQAKAQGLVLAAMAINGVHHTLHIERGWIPTEQLMKATMGKSQNPLLQSILDKI